MTKVPRSLINRFCALLLLGVATGCSHTPYTPTTGPLLTTGFFAGGTLQTARVDVVDVEDDAPILSCPGKGRQGCEVNWRYLHEGQTAAEVVDWLGQPAHQTGPDIFVEKVVSEWRYQHDGVVYFENDQLRYVDLPTTFEYTL